MSGSPTFLAELGRNAIWLLFLALGIKLVLIGRRARSLPEVLLGAALMLSGPGAGFLQHGVANDDPTSTTLGMVLVTVGGTCTLCFAYLVFRPGERWAQLLVTGLVAWYVAGVCHQLFVLGLAPQGNHSPSLVFLAARAAGLGWCAYESLRYRAMYVKRLDLGLADPVIANRFLLYAVWTGALAVMPVVVALASVLGEGNEAWRAAFLVPVRFVGLVVLVSMLLIFVPPRAYVQYVERRHARRMEQAA